MKEKFVKVWNWIKSHKIETGVFLFMLLGVSLAFFGYLQLCKIQKYCLAIGCMSGAISLFVHSIEFLGQAIDESKDDDKGKTLQGD